MTKRILVVLTLGLLLFANTAFAEDVDYTGTYTMQGPEDTITLNIQQDSEGNITGTLSSTTGLSLKVEGILSEGMAVGACYNDDMGVFFEAGFEGETLIFNMIEPDENQEPDYNKTTQLTFTKGAGSTPSKPKSKMPQSLKGQLTGGTEEEVTPEEETGEMPKSKISHTADSSEISEGEIGNKSWGFKFKAPKDWVYEVSAESVMLGHNTIAGLLLVVTHDDGSFEAMKDAMKDGLKEESISLKPIGN